MYLSIIYLQSLDGFLARSIEDDLSWATREDRDFFISKTKEIGVMIMGSTTFNRMRGVKGTAFKDRDILVMTSKPEDYKNYRNDFAKSITFLTGSPEDIVDYLKIKGFKHAAVVGGGKVIQQFLKSGLADELFITIAPVIFGKGVPTCDGELEKMNLELLESVKISQNEILLHYKVIH